MNEPDIPRPVQRDRRAALRALIRRAWPFASGVAATLIGLFIFSATTPKAPVITQNDVQTAIIQAMASATAPPPRASLVFAVIRPSLVLIQAKVPGAGGKIADGLGSGVIVNDEGLILTSLHVVEGATEIKVTFADGTQSAAQIAAEQPEDDIAVLQPATLPEQFVPAVLGNPNAMNVGDDAYVVGSPFGLYGSMSAGVISGFGRSFKSPSTGKEIDELIQVDAAVNPGNSGGPLVNRNGEVVGIVVALFNPTEQNVFIGIGFAVPITTAGGAAGAPPY